MRLKTALCVTLSIAFLVGSAFGQEQFLKEGESFKGVYAGFSNNDHNTALSAGFLLAPSNQVGVGVGFSRITGGGVSAWVAGASMSVWPVNEARQNTPVSICLFAGYDLTVQREPGFPDWAYGFGALMGKTIKINERNAIQPYGGMSFQKSELANDEFLEVGHAGLIFAGRTEKGGMGFLNIEASFFEGESAVSLSVGFLGP